MLAMLHLFYPQIYLITYTYIPRPHPPKKTPKKLKYYHLPQEMSPTAPEGLRFNENVAVSVILLWQVMGRVITMLQHLLSTPAARLNR